MSQARKKRNRDAETKLRISAALFPFRGHPLRSREPPNPKPTPETDPPQGQTRPAQPDRAALPFPPLRARRRSGRSTGGGTGDGPCPAARGGSLGTREPRLPRSPAHGPAAPHRQRLRGAPGAAPEGAAGPGLRHRAGPGTERSPGAAAPSGARCGVSGDRGQVRPKNSRSPLQLNGGGNIECRAARSTGRDRSSDGVTGTTG